MNRYIQRIGLIIIIVVVGSTVLGSSVHYANPGHHASSHQPGGLDAINNPSFSVHKNGVNQTAIVSGVFTLVTWSTEEFDTNNNFAANRFTPTVAGKYGLCTALYYNGPLADAVDMEAIVYKNGAAYKRASKKLSGTGGQGISFSVEADANGSTDYFEIYTYQATGSDKVLLGDATYTYFQGGKID